MEVLRASGSSVYVILATGGALLHLHQHFFYCSGTALRSYAQHIQDSLKVPARGFSIHRPAVVAADGLCFLNRHTECPVHPHESLKTKI